jgi:hypothetical protein
MSWMRHKGGIMADDAESDSSNGGKRQRDTSQAMTRNQVGALRFAAAAFSAFVVFVLASMAVGPIASERLISVGLIAFSASFAAIAFAFLGRQTANIRVKYLGAGISIGGAGAVLLIVFGGLQFIVRGTSTLYIEIFSDDAFTHRWRPSARQRVPEFSASLKYYSITANPEGSNLRLINLPIFETVSISTRDPQWQVTKLSSDERLCKVEGQRLSGWCTEAKVALQYSNCIEDWTGSGSLPQGTLDGLLKHFVREMQDVGYPAKLKLGPGDQVSKVLAAKIGATSYNGQDFCTAIYGAKNDIERNQKTQLHIKLGCAFIGLSVGDVPFPELGEEPNGWRKAC